jgi:hypothetical protein
MKLSEFTNSLQNAQPPEGSVYIQALWYDRKDKWQKAHELVDHLGDKDACWVHAYLHRKEGDIWNADYWYARAGRKRPSVSLEEEWQQLVDGFLKAG